MHKLPCPACQTPLVVSAAQAGGRVPCPSCGQVVSVPRLGDLRKLAAADDTAGAAPATPRSRGEASSARGEASLARQATFVGSGMIAIVALIFFGFCGLRWFLMETPRSTQSHIAEIRETYPKLSAAELIREWEDMERFGIATTVPFTYRSEQLAKRELGIKTIVAGGVALAAIATAVAATGRRKSTNLVG